LILVKILINGGLKAVFRLGKRSQIKSVVFEMRDFGVLQPGLGTLNQLDHVV